MVVPARGGSVGVPRKNLRPVAGLPLVAHVGRVVTALAWVDRAVVSTDDDEIARVAAEAGLEAAFRRPEALAGDRVGDLDVLVHALEASEAVFDERYDVVVMLQPTCPLRRPAHVTDCAAALVESDLDSVWTVSPTDLKYHPEKQLVVAADGLLSYWHPGGASVVARQQLSPVFHRNGAAYAMTRACLLEQRAILGKRSAALRIDEPMWSIDTLEDFERVEAALRERAGEGTT